MSAEILDGKALVAQLKEELAKEISFLKKESGQAPYIVSIVIGNDPACLSYVSSQKKTAEALGIRYDLKNVSENITQERLFLDVIDPLNEDKQVHGILLNKPIPAQIDFDFSMASIDPWKNIEGMNGYHLGQLMLGDSKFVPCTAAAAVALLKSSGVVLGGKRAVVIGRSEIVGKPVALLLLQENMTVTICHSKTIHLKEEVQRADVVVVAVGKPLLVKGDWIKQGAIVIDVGINQHAGKIVGDVDFESCRSKSSWITPVPGGVGPVTAVMLMKNTVQAVKQMEAFKQTL